MNSGRQWRTGEPGVLQSMGGHKELDTTRQLNTSNNNVNKHESWKGQAPDSNRSFFLFVSSALSCGMWDLLWPAHRLSSCGLQAQ